ncbi:MAG: Rne/Rng family ribonuclease [Coriobacteriia bacterium]|nr:Rne/Rng family ribonuclease [Coriobacteriia bacterium]MCL2605791.1 Rne/Rng family ribonuclease [Coriobacteriia bacterium]
MATSITREMLISQDHSELRVAICEDKQLVELYIERAKRSVVGNIYLGKVTDVLPGMQAAFVDIGLEKNTYLYIDDLRVDGERVESARQISSYLQVGQTVMVQVVKDAMGTKGARVTMELSIPGRFLVLLPYSDRRAVSKKIGESQREELIALMQHELSEGVGAIARTATKDAATEDIIADIKLLTRIWDRVKRQSIEVAAPDVLYTEVDLAMRSARDIFTSEYSSLTIDNRQTYDKVVGLMKRSAPELVKRVNLYRSRGEPLFNRYDIEDAIAQSLRREVSLPSGGSIVIDKTEALVTIDVNTGSFVGKRTLEDTLLKTNLEAAIEAVRQLRLRDLGGIIIIDFIDMQLDASKEKLLEELQELLARDRTRTKLVGLDSLGLVEITRKNISDGLFQTISEVCSYCAGQGRRLSAATRRIEIDRRLRNYVVSSKQQSFLFAINDETYEIVTAAGINLAAAIKADTGKMVRLFPDSSLQAIDFECLIEGQSPSSAEQRSVQAPAAARFFGRG